MAGLTFGSQCYKVIQDIKDYIWAGYTLNLSSDRFSERNEMKSCKDCGYANWYRTSSGKLHPSGDGKCEFKWKLPPIPQAFYLLKSNSLCGGYISRKKELNDHCAYFTRKE